MTATLWLLAPWLIGDMATAQVTTPPSQQADAVVTGEAKEGSSGPTVGDPAPSSAPDQPAPPANPFSLQLNLDVTNAYFYRGILQQDDGAIVQPAAKLNVRAFENDDWTIDVFLATWNSFGSNGGSNTSDFIKNWYECDLLAGVVITRGNLSLTTSYVFLTSPSDAFATVQELDLTLSYDDSDLLGAFALHPYALVAIETGSAAADGADSDLGTYLELGVAPGFSFDLGETPVSVSFPLSVGLSLHDYYQDAAGSDDTFGFFQAGAKASIPLPFGDQFGKWSLNAGVAGLFLGDATAAYNNGSDAEFIATAGVQVNF